MRGGDRRERKLDLDPGRRDQDDLAFNHARDRIPGALVLTQRFSHRSLSCPHKRAGVKTEIAVTFSTGFRLTVSGRCLSHSGTLACPRLGNYSAVSTVTLRGSSTRLEASSTSIDTMFPLAS